MATTSTENRLQRLDPDVALLNDLLKTNLRLQPAQDDLFRGADVPVNARLEIYRANAKPSESLVRLYEPRSAIPAVEIIIQRPYKYGQSNRTYAVGLLHRGSRDTLRLAVSGWAQVFENQYQLSNAVWTPLVFDMCESIGYTLPKDWRDKGVPGRYNACHVEKQLLAYDYFNPSQSKRLTIHVSWSMCDDCEACVKQFVRKTGRSVKVVVNGAGTEYYTSPKLAAEAALRQALRRSTGCGQEGCALCLDGRI